MREVAGYKLVRTLLALGSLFTLCSIGFSATATEPSSSAEPGPKLLRLSVGETTPVAGEAGSYERVLVMPPGGENTTAENAWEISADLAIKLARLPREERWRVIRRNLGLAPDDNTDLILWSEVADAAFDSIAKLPFEGEPGGGAFGLRVAFPGKGTSDPPADVALTFTNTDIEKNPKKQIDAESPLKKGITEALTGIEGFVEFAADSGSPPPSEALAAIEVRLLDSNRKLVSVSEVRQGYFCFPHLPVDPDFGSDYYLEAALKQEASFSALAPKQIYVPVMRGIRTRLRLTVPRPEQPFVPGEKGLNTQDWAISGGPAAMLLQQFVGGSGLLGAIAQRLPANPGLHLGLVQVPGRGPTPLWSSRFVLRPPVLDRRPQFVSRGKLRMQCLTVAAAPGQPSYRYTKLTWFAHAEEPELKLSSRHVNETPWGIGMGVAPSLDPALYAVGASYKLIPSAELLAGVGIQEGHSDSFIYGVTLDADRLLDGILGKKNGGE